MAYHSTRLELFAICCHVSVLVNVQQVTPHRALQSTQGHLVCGVLRLTAIFA